MSFSTLREEPEEEVHVVDCLGQECKWPKPTKTTDSWAAKCEIASFSCALLRVYALNTSRAMEIVEG